MQPDRIVPLLAWQSRILDQLRFLLKQDRRQFTLSRYYELVSSHRVSGELSFSSDLLDVLLVDEKITHYLCFRSHCDHSCFPSGQVNGRESLTGASILDAEQQGLHLGNFVHYKIAPK